MSLPWWALAVILVPLFAMVFIMGFGIGAGTDIISSRRPPYLMEDDRDGWFIRPHKRFVCGAFYGHKWEPVTYMTETTGTRREICRWCGKERVKG